METTQVRIELSQGDKSMNLVRTFEKSELIGVDAISNTIAFHVLNVFNTAKDCGIKLDFKFSQAFKLNIYSEGKSLMFKDSIFHELGLQGFKVVNTDKSKERLAKFIGRMVEQTIFKADVDAVASEEDVLEVAKKILVA